MCKILTGKGTYDVLFDGGEAGLDESNFLLVVHGGTDGRDDHDSNHDREALNPSYYD